MTHDAPMIGRPSPSRSALIKALAALVLTAILVALLVASRSDNGAIGVAMLAAERMAEGAAIYRAEGGGAFSYPPFMALIHLPLLELGQTVQRALIYTINLSILGLAIFWLQRAGRASFSAGASWRGARDRRAWIAAILVAMIALRFAASAVTGQGHDLLILAALLAVWRLGAGAAQRHEAWAGAAAGIGAALKATPLLFLPLLLGQRRWLGAGALIAALLAATFLPDLVAPADSGQPWVRQWVETFIVKIAPGGAADAAGAWGAFANGNQSLAGTLHRLTTPLSAEIAALANEKDVTLLALDPTSRQIFILAAQGAIFATLLWTLCYRRQGATDLWVRLGETGLAAAAMVLLSPMSSKPHFALLLLPATFAAVETLVRPTPRPWRRRAILTLLALAAILNSFLGKDLIGREIANWALSAGAVTWATLAVFLATALALGGAKDQITQGSAPTRVVGAKARD